jgi:hypothetical protein
MEIIPVHSTGNRFYGTAARLKFMTKNRLFLEDRYIAKLSRDFLEPVPTRWADDYSNTITAMYLALSRTLRAVFWPSHPQAAVTPVVMLLSDKWMLGSLLDSQLPTSGPPRVATFKARRR